MTIQFGSPRNRMYPLITTNPYRQAAEARDLVVSPGWSVLLRESPDWPS